MANSLEFEKVKKFKVSNVTVSENKKRITFYFKNTNIFMTFNTCDDTSNSYTIFDSTHSLQSLVGKNLCNMIEYDDIGEDIIDTGDYINIKKCSCIDAEGKKYDFNLVNESNGYYTGYMRVDTGTLSYQSNSEEIKETEKPLKVKLNEEQITYVEDTLRKVLEEGVFNHEEIMRKFNKFLRED